MLQRGEARVTVRIEDRTVSVTHRGETRGCSYQKMEQAWCVYEANVAGACADGFVEQSTLCSPSNPGVLEDFEHPDKNELYSAEWHEGLVHALAIDANDPVALEDGTRAYLHHAPELGWFERSTMDPWLEVEHALRRATHHPLAEHVETFDLLLFSLDLLPRMRPWLTRVTHLDIHRSGTSTPIEVFARLDTMAPRLERLHLRWLQPHFEDTRWVRSQYWARRLTVVIGEAHQL
jgi:hypothetical protein